MNASDLQKTKRKTKGMETLWIKIEKGTDLVAADSGGTSDPYVVITRFIPGSKKHGDGSKVAKTKVIKKNCQSSLV